MLLWIPGITFRGIWNCLNWSAWGVHVSYFKICINCSAVCFVGVIYCICIFYCKVFCSKCKLSVCKCTACSWLCWRLGKVTLVKQILMSARLFFFFFTWLNDSLVVWNLGFCLLEHPCLAPWVFQPIKAQLISQMFWKRSLSVMTNKLHPV